MLNNLTNPKQRFQPVLKHAKRLAHQCEGAAAGLSASLGHLVVEVGVFEVGETQGGGFFENQHIGAVPEQGPKELLAHL